MIATTTELSGSSSVRRDYSFANRMAIAMLGINLVGFAPTLYLRPLFDVEPIPPYLYFHGAIGTAWFLLYAVQSTLINRSSFSAHRRLGWTGLVIAILVLGSGVYTSANMVPRNSALGAVSEADIALYEAVTTGDVTAFIIFPAFVVAALFLRRRSDFHWRLIMLASISILGPALARMASWIAEFPNPLPGVALLGVVALMCLHDLRTRTRVHLATAIGGGLTIGLFLLMRLSGIGPAIVAAKLGQ